MYQLKKKLNYINTFHFLAIRMTLTDSVVKAHYTHHFKCYLLQADRPNYVPMTARTRATRPAFLVLLEVLGLLG